MSNRVVALKYLQARMPVYQTLLAWLSLDHWQCPGWAWGIVGTVVVLLWLAWLVCLAKEQRCEPVWQRKVE